MLREERFDSRVQLHFVLDVAHAVALAADEHFFQRDVVPLQDRDETARLTDIYDIVIFAKREEDRYLAPIGATQWRHRVVTLLDLGGIAQATQQPPVLA